MKYNWYKEFGCPKEIEDMAWDEVQSIMMIGSRLKQAENEMMARNRPKK